MTLPLRVEPAHARHADGLVALLAAECSGCFCRWWHFEGDKNAWIGRCALEPERNEAALREALAAGSDDARGVVALADDEVVGWLKLAPAASVPKLYDQKLYRGLPVLDRPTAGVLAVACVVVRADRRRQGVAHALVGGALEAARASGATSVEAFPRRSAEPVHDAELWMGPASAFVAQGFEVAHEFGPYPVLRRAP